MWLLARACLSSRSQAQRGVRGLSLYQNRSYPTLALLHPSKKERTLETNTSLLINQQRNRVNKENHCRAVCTFNFDTSLLSIKIRLRHFQRKTFDFKNLLFNICQFIHESLNESRRLRMNISPADCETNDFFFIYQERRTGGNKFNY